MTKANWSTAGGSSLADTPTESMDCPSVNAESPPPTAPPVKKRKGGLLTAAQLKEEAEAQAIEEARKEAERQRERAEMRRIKIEAGEEVSADEGDERPDHQQTIHRDRTGKIVDVNAERAEAQKREQEDRARQAAKKDWNKGLVQRNQRDEELRRERQSAGTSFARSVGLGRGCIRRNADSFIALLRRSAHDRSMNEEQRNEVRREDPAAAFLTVSLMSFCRYSGVVLVLIVPTCAIETKKERPAASKIHWTGTPTKSIRDPAWFPMGWSW
jgi:pre-mRNA-splicing factor CWC26